MCHKFQPRAVLFAFLSFVCVLFGFVAGRSYNNGLIFYDLQSFRPYLPPTVSVSRGRGLANFKFSDKGSIWSTFGKPCECHKNLCGCCAGIKVKQYNFDQKMCANVTFVPPKEEALLEVYLNDRPSSKYGLSVRNPSPFCIPVMMGIPMAMCVQMSDIAIKGNNLNMCMDFIVRLATADLFEMHFQCMQMGLDGFQYIDKNGNPVIPPSNSRDDATSNTDDDYYDYDEADENEISYGISEQNVSVKEESQQLTAQPSSDAINQIKNPVNDATVNLQQQMQQLQSVQQYDIEKNDLLTQIQHNYHDEHNDDDDGETTTLAPIVVDEAESEPDLITAITMAYDGTVATATADAMKTVKEQAAHTPTLSTPTTLQIAANPVNNDDYGNDVPLTNYNEQTSATTVNAANLSATTTTVTPVSKPIAAPTNNAYGEAAAITEIENVDIANTASIDADAATIPLESINDNYASTASADSNIDFVATTVAYDGVDAEDADDDEAYIAAPAATTAAIAFASIASAINSTKQQNNSMPTSMTLVIATASPLNTYATENDADPTSAVPSATTAATATTTTTTTPLQLAKTPTTNVAADTATTFNVEVPQQPEIPATATKPVASFPKYRRFYA